MKSWKILYTIIPPFMRSTTVTAIDYQSSKVEFERLTGVSKSNVLKSIVNSYTIKR